MKELNIEKNLLYYVRLVKRLYEKLLTEVAAECDLALAEADGLLFLKEYPDYNSARDVALLREVSPAYVSKAVETLVQRGYVTTSQDKKDRRIQHLYITELAQPTADMLHEAQMKFFEMIVDGLTADEFAELVQIVGKCIINIQLAVE